MGPAKSTILNLILGSLEPDGGSVFKSKNLRLGYLPQDLIQLSGQTVLELAMDTGERLSEVESELEAVHHALAQGPDTAELDELLARQGQLQTFFEMLGGYDLQARAEKVLAGLGFKDEQFNEDVSVAQRRLAHARSPGPHPALRPGPDPFGRAHQPPGSGIHALAGRTAGLQPGFSASGQPRPGFSG